MKCLVLLWTLIIDFVDEGSFYFRSKFPDKTSVSFCNLVQLLEILKDAFVSFPFIRDSSKKVMRFL